jgi:hypothetical protein
MLLPRASLVFAACLLIAPALSAENLISNGSSFEAGLGGWALGLLNGRYHRECASVLLEIDRATAADGMCSLRLTRPASAQNRYAVFYKPLALRPGRSYTFSAFLKSQQDGAQMNLLFGGFPQAEERGPGPRPRPLKQQAVRLTSEWQRYELHVPSLSASAPAEGARDLNLYYVALAPGQGGATFWIDAVRLDEGDETKPLAADQPLEISVSTQRPGNLFYPGEAITPAVSVYLAHAPGKVALTCRATDVLGQTVAASRKSVEVPAHGHAAVMLEGVPLHERGWLMLEVTASSGLHSAKAYVSAAVIRKVPASTPDQACQFGFDLNSITSPDDFGAGAKWHESNTHLNLDRVFTLASQAGVAWFRMAGIFMWQRGRSVETAPGKFNFYDDAVKAVKGYGLNLMGTLGNANAREGFGPEWADSGRKSRNLPLPTEESWRRYVRTMVGHYKADIKTWEIINEPPTGMLAEDYLPLLKQAYEETKAADPRCKVAGICGTSDFVEGQLDPVGYVRKVVEKGGLRYLDIVSGHTLCKGRPWQSRGEAPTWEYIPSLVELFHKFAPGRSFPIWNTEGVKYGAWTDRPDVPHTTSEYADRRINRNAVVSQRMAAAYAVRDAVIEFSSGAQVLFLWEFRFSPLNSSIAFAGALGLTDWFGFDGTPHAKFVAVNALAEKLWGARPVEQFGLSPRVRCAVFQSPKEVFALVWRENQDESDLHTYMLPVESRLQVQDLFGRPLPAQTASNTQVPVSEVPVYVVAPKNLDAARLSGLLKAAGQQVKFTHDTPLANPFMRRSGRGPGEPRAFRSETDAGPLSVQDRRRIR